MNIFIIGMPQSGRTSVAKSLCRSGEFHYIDGFSWIKNSFREQKADEHPQQYNDEFHYWFTDRLKNNPSMIADSILSSMKLHGDSNYAIDGIISPKDFMQLFDFNKDLVVFLNRTEGDVDTKDYENIGVSVIRDYCFWLSSAGLLPKEKWYEFNFKMSEDHLDFAKVLGSKNTVMIVKGGTKKIVEILNDAITKLP